MNNLRIFAIIAWISLPTVMFGGYALLSMLVRNGISEFQQTYFRAGHAHAGVLILMALLYLNYIQQTNLNMTAQFGGATAVLIGILAQSGGFFLHMYLGSPGEPSLGTTVTILGAIILAGAIFLLVYGLFISR